MEGLVTNFFVVVVEEGAAGGGGSGGSGAAHHCVRLLGPGAGSPALAGVTQARVEEAARRLGMQVTGTPPRAADRGAWSEAFITNW